MADTIILNQENSNNIQKQTTNISNDSSILKISKFSKTIKETSKNIVSFNVMPNKQVCETLNIKEYLIKHREITGVFDREYETSMRNSPNHLIFLTALVHLQKLIYVYLCDEFGFTYDPFGDEVLKVWPTNLEIEMPKMITKTRDVKQHVKINSLRKTGEKSYFGNCFSTIEGIVTIKADAAVFII